MLRAPKNPSDTAYSTSMIMYGSSPIHISSCLRGIPTHEDSVNLSRDPSSLRTTMVMRLDDLGVPLRAERAGGLANQAEHEVDAEREVGREHDRGDPGQLGDRGLVGRREAGRTDHRGAPEPSGCLGGLPGRGRPREV